MKFSKTEKEQLVIYAAVAFGITYALGILMWYGYRTGKSLAVFSNAQMFYPAAGVMALLIVGKYRDALRETDGKEKPNAVCFKNRLIGQKELPMRFFVSYLVVTGLLIVIAASSIFLPDESAALCLSVCNLLIIVGSIFCGVFLLTEKKEKRAAFGLTGKNWKASFACITLFFVLCVLRSAALLPWSMKKNLQEMAGLLADPITWSMLLQVMLYFFLTYLAFFGEEYGWRYYLQPLLQKRYGKRIGVIIVGIVWGLWHLPLDFFYYTSPDMGLEQALSHLIGCIFRGIFYAYAYMKTENIWVPVMLHYMNNNLSAVFFRNGVPEVLNSAITEEYILKFLMIHVILYGSFLFSKEFRADHQKADKRGKE